VVPRLPAPEDLLVQLALHAAFQHGLVLTLGQYQDFARVIASGAIDGERLSEAARAAAAGPALAASLAAADALFGLELDGGVRARVLEPRPRGLEAWLSRALDDPAGWFLTPRPVPLARVRWGLCRGRRLQLLARTLSPPPPGAPLPLRARLLAAPARGWGLLRRWLLP
jgi:hypothetical protein